jgi:hypothetical protein
MIRILIAALGLLALGAFGATAAVAHGDDQGGAPKIGDRSPASVTDTSATLRASIDPNSNDDWWWMGPTSYGFQFGLTTSYGTTAGSGSLDPWLDSTTVSVPVSGLTPGTKYNYRAVASNVDGTTYGRNTSFKTSGKAPGATSSGPKAPGATLAPTLGQSVVAEAAAGTVLVKEEGETEFHPIDEAEEIAANSTFDTTEGTVSIEASGGDGESYSGDFHGGTFQVIQSANGKGMTKIALRGGDFSACDSQVNARANASGRHLVLRKLWGKDHGGRFKTSGRGSVATVRGTVWYTADSCDGTLTKVSKGAVMVHERGSGRSKLLHKGESFFAHLPH